jgi:hypothetical protein
MTARTGSTLLAMAITTLAGLAACALSVVSGERPVLTVGYVAAVTVVAAVVTGWRWLGSAATMATTATVLFAAAISSERIGPVHLVGASVLLLVLVAGLDRVELSARSPRTVVLDRAPLARRIAVPLLATAATAGVAITATAPVVPSVGLVLLGLLAGLAALLVATRAS